MHIFDKYWGCHQMAERSFFIKGYQLPACARCTGLIIGECVSILLFITDLRLSSLFNILLLIPLSLDGIIQYKTAYESNNVKRLTTGILFGFGFIQIIMQTIFFILK